MSNRLAPLEQIADRILDINTAAALAGISRSTLYRWAAEKQFPRVIKTGPKRSGISLNAFNKWLKERTGENEKTAA